MNDTALLEPHGVLVEPTTLRIERLLPGPIERIWAYLTDSDLRRRWLASGAMEQRLGATTELVWRNQELNDPPTARPEGMPEEHRMVVTVTEIDPPRRLGITWGASGGVTFTLEPKGKDVLLTILHRRAPDRNTLLNVSAGWHAHLDMLAAEVTGQAKPAHWDNWVRLRAEYDGRFPA